MSGSPFGIGEFLAADKQSDAYSDASSDATKVANKQIALLEKMFNQQVKWQKPYMGVGEQGVAKLEVAESPYGDAAKYVDQIEGLGLADLPQLNLDEFSYQFDPNDPTYQYRQQFLWLGHQLQAT